MMVMIVTVSLAIAGGCIAGCGFVQNDGAKIAIGVLMFAVAMGLTLIPG